MFDMVCPVFYALLHSNPQGRSGNRPTTPLTVIVA